MIDIFITAFQRPRFTELTIEYLLERTKYPFRLFLINNGGNEKIAEEYNKEIFLTINPNKNLGIHASWNLALSLAESEYFITSDNDIYVPDLAHKAMGRVLRPGSDWIYKQVDDEKLHPCWLEWLVRFMDERKDYGAISLHPHVLIGSPSFDPNDPEDVKEVDHCGAVMRIMRTEAVRQAGGWEHWVRSGRNHEERTICSRLQTIGYKVGRTTRLRAYHPFTKNWGYEESFTPEMQGHNPELADYVTQFDNMDSYDERSWLPK